MVCTSEYYLQHKQPAHYLVRKRGKQEWRKLLPISARKRLRGSWEIGRDILGSNPSCIKTEKKNQDKSQFREEKLLRGSFRELTMYNLRLWAN